jgi:hypothetical protein
MLQDKAKAYLDALGAANRAFARTYPGDSPLRQPVHTVYGGAQLYRADTTLRLGELARASMSTYARDPLELARGVGFLSASACEGVDALELQRRFESDAVALRAESPQLWLACTVYQRVREKLQREPVEDFRIDFEDGFGARPDDEEDAVARQAAAELARSRRARCRRSSASASSR